MKDTRKKPLAEGEEIITNLYEHWIVLIKPFFAFAVGSVLFAFMLLFAQELLENEYVDFAAVVILIAVATFWVILHWLFIFLFQWVVSDWFITTKRLIEFELLVFVKHDLSYVNLNRIHEIEQHQHGILANVLNFGHVRLNLSALATSKDLQFLPQPSKFVSLIEHLQQTPEESLDLSRLRKKYKY